MVLRQHCRIPAARPFSGNHRRPAVEQPESSGKRIATRQVRGERTWADRPLGLIGTERQKADPRRTDADRPIGGSAALFSRTVATPKTEAKSGAVKVRAWALATGP